MKHKWRPPLALIIGGTLAAFLCLPLIAIGYFRVAGNILGWGETALLLACLAVGATALLAFLLWRLVLRPVWKLTDYAKTLQRGEPAVRPDHFGTPEMHDLGNAVTAMNDTLEARATSLHAYADHVTHELKSPLTSLRGSAELLQTAETPEMQVQLARNIDEAAARMEQILAALHQHARADQSAGHGTARLSTVAQGLPEVFVDVDGEVPLIEADLRVILDQMTQNALTHGASGLRIACGAGQLDLVDDGSGIAPGDRERIFDPFFTTRRESGGTGMGLSIVQRLLLARGARIFLLDCSKGAHFRIIFAD